MHRSNNGDRRSDPVQRVLGRRQIDGEREFEAYLAEHYRLLESQRFLEDDAAALKQRFLTNQLNVRIEIRAYERLTESGAS